MQERFEHEDHPFRPGDAATFDSLADFDFSNDEGAESQIPDMFEEGPFGMPNPEAVPQFQRNLVAFDEHDTDEERIEALFDQMPTLQHMLFSILRECSTPVSDGQLEEHIDDLKRQHHSVYSPATFATLLERAGAIEKTDSEGVPLVSGECEPLMIERDGEQFWKVAPAPAVYWTITTPGSAKLATYKPVERIRECFDSEPHYSDIFETVLRMCAEEGGTTVKLIGDAVDDEPILQNPRRFAMYFIDKLEKAGGIAWRGSWSITEHGLAFLEMQAHITEDTSQSATSIETTRYGN